MAYPTYFIFLLLLSTSRAHSLLPREETQFFAINVFTKFGVGVDNPHSLGYLSSAGRITPKLETVYAIPYPEKKLVVYDAKAPRPQVGIIGAAPDIPNWILKAIPPAKVAEQAPLSNEWYMDPEGAQWLRWYNQEFPRASHSAYFCAMNTPGAEVYAVFKYGASPLNCMNVTLNAEMGK